MVSAQQGAVIRTSFESLCRFQSAANDVKDLSNGLVICLQRRGRTFGGKLPADATRGEHDIVVRSLS